MIFSWFDSFPSFFDSGLTRPCLCLFLATRLPRAAVEGPLATSVPTRFLCAFVVARLQTGSFLPARFQCLPSAPFAKGASKEAHFLRFFRPGPIPSSICRCPFFRCKMPAMKQAKETPPKGSSKPCECGCGKYPKKPTSRFLPGHDLKKAYKEKTF